MSEITGQDTLQLGYLAGYGAEVLENGYSVLPIAPGGKRPYQHVEGWQTIETTPKMLQRWIKEGCGRGGIGINARLAPAVDIDVNDEDVAQAMEQWILAHIGPA